MATGKETPRQKMIGMMYLVLTALLALNVSKDILEAFVVVNASLEKTNENFNNKTVQQYAAFDKAKQIDKDKVVKNWQSAQEVRMLSTQMTTYIDSLKKILIQYTEGVSIHMADTMQLKFVKNKDNYDIPTNIMIGEQHNGKGAMAEKLKNKLVDYKKKLYSCILEKDKNEFSIEINTDDPAKKENNENWELHNFYHTPLAATITILSKLTTDIKKAESEVVEYLYKLNTVDDFNFDTIAAKVIAKSNYVLLGEEYKADVFLAAFSKTQQPVIYAGTFNNNQTMLNDSILVQQGIGKYAIKPTREGLYKWGGQLSMVSPSGNKKTYLFESEYIVAQPTAVASADNMNAMYIGVPNPVSIAVPGVADENVVVSVSNGQITKTAKGKYNLTLVNGIETKINIAAKFENETRTMGVQTFRVRPLPKPLAVVANVEETGVISKQLLLAYGKVNAKYPSWFLYSAQAKVISCTVDITINGVSTTLQLPQGKFNADFASYVNRLRSGSKLIFEITAKGPDNIPHKLPLIVTLL